MLTLNNANFEEETGPVISLGTGMLSKDQLDGVIATLPVDITFIDRQDVVRFYSQPRAKERIFLRTRAVIGRKVQDCHPKKSVRIVNQILAALKSSSRDVAEFWIDLKGRSLHIRYFAVRNAKGEYLGTLEVTQDITDIKKLEGERRLLDWK